MDFAGRSWAQVGRRYDIADVEIPRRAVAGGRIVIADCNEPTPDGPRSMPVALITAITTPFSVGDGEAVSLRAVSVSEIVCLTANSHQTVMNFSRDCYAPFLV
jgi:hypothetical protein